MTEGIPDPLTDFKAYQTSLFKSLVSATAAVNAIPVEEIGYFRSLDRSFAKDLDLASENTLQVGNELLQKLSIESGIDLKTVFEDVEDVKSAYSNVIDVCDSLLDKADICLDHLKGKIKTEDDPIAPEITQFTKENADYKLLHSSRVIRPQMKFKDAVNNSNVVPFERKIKYKPHAQTPLDDTPVFEDGVEKSLAHPYVYEIQNIKYPESMFVAHEPKPFTPLDSEDPVWVDTEAGLEAMMKSLEDVEEIAVDLEHHNYRSFQGFTCLMQLSTRTQDFIIDTLELRDKLWRLNEYFADPAIVKVLHGADSDIIWLQRDLGLYIVNLFDTYFPTKVLEFPQHGLAYLLKKYCQYDSDKKYQLADWRIRPLPQEMMVYARADTHFLLYIYDCLRNELLAASTHGANLMDTCLQRSNEVAIQKHDKEIYDAQEGLGPNGWKNMLHKWKYSMNGQQLAVFKALHAWRDHTARDQDESIRYVLPNHMLFTLVERMPTDSSGVIGACNPCPPLVRMNAQALGLLIQKAKMDGLLMPVKEEPKMTAATPIKTQVTPAAQKKRVQVDPSVFDLTLAKKIRLETCVQLEKKNSTLFGSFL
ncbi:ribonuclease H-like domain-containing protein [Sporodiniella umbellata]|nr:ribonuclease H-like domain-containing protein [Sporodiniella umbellata]